MQHNRSKMTLHDLRKYSRRVPNAKLVTPASRLADYMASILNKGAFFRIFPSFRRGKRKQRESATSDENRRAAGLLLNPVPDNKLQGKYRGEMGGSLETTDPSRTAGGLPSAKTKKRLVLCTRRQGSDPACGSIPSYLCDPKK